MKIFKILLCAAFIFTISACNGKKDSPYDYPDEDPTTAEKGDAGDPCQKNADCKEGLFCIDKVCSEPSSDEDTVEDSDTQPDEDEPADDTDSDTNDPDTTPTDDTDTGTTDEDEPEDSDTQPDEDEDIPEYIPECGNGIRDPGEECDNGLENSDEPGIPGITCRIDCVFARCQDGIVDNSEICDDGNASVGDYCSPDCQSITGYCGDGVQQTNEMCDPGIDPYCADDCSGIAGYCGDGVKQNHEACDKAEPGEGGGEGIGPYYCSVNCKTIMGSCGDGEIQLNEVCDDKDKNGRYGYCNSTCSGKGPRCGDGNIDTGNEVCDDGNTKDGDYCSADCKTSYGRCGDGIKQDFEACDNANHGDGVGVYCSDDCRQLYGRCGDGNLNPEAGEECDEGANNNQEYCPYGSSAGCTLCSPACRYRDGIPRYCGDGVVSNLSGEVCDNATFGSGTGPYYCSADCTEIIGSCGDGEKQPNEACDPGLDPYCSADCKKSEGHCGDGTKNGDEECDNAGDNGKTDCEYGQTSCKVCTTSCTLADGTPHYCGNRTVDTGETCDDGTENGSYGKCNSDCSGLGKHCGDGNIDSANGEVCDNGENNGQMKCPYGEEICKVCASDCKEIVDGNASYCGDGKIQRENCLDYGPKCVVTEGVNEECDDAELNGTYGHCLAGCYGAGQRCGDGEINGNEVCDDGDGVNGQYGKCKTDCSGLGERCGDGTVQRDQGEICDDGDDNGKYTQDSPGHCNNDCKGYGEGGFCGDHTQNGTEACDEGEEFNGRIPCPYGETSCKVCSTRCRLVNGNTSYCGDGERDPDHEFCDEGTSNGDYNAPCNSECSAFPPKCGDGNTDDTFGEVCDDKELNGTYNFSEPGHCNNNCLGFGEGGFCGDGTQNGNETCDTGVLNGNYGGVCNSTCSGSPAYCGDRKIQSRALCTADDETLAANGYSSLNDFFVQNGFADAEACLAQLTGATEACDEGEGINGQYNHCNSECTAKLECGDGVIQSEYGEQCDQGAANGTTDKCEYGQENCELCTANCIKFTGLTSYCGDEVIDTDNGEVCDSGKDFNGTYGYCNSDCKGYTKCGDKRIQRKNCGTMPLCDENTTENCCEVVEELVLDEECDEGELNGTYGHCRSDCSGISECGDGIPQPEEACDNGEPFNGTYGNCKSDCSGITGYCDDGILQKADCGGEEGCVEIPGAGEECDRGNANGRTACNYGEKDCNVCTDECKQIKGTTSYCGDKNVDEYYENCDDGEEVNGTFGKCDETCQETVTWRCGDGNLDFLHGEICDRGDGVNGTYTMEKPGTCNSDCKGYGAGGFCGDGIIQSEHGETCDDGENNNTEGHCNSTCNGQTPVCGNGTVEPGESCDDGTNKNGKYTLAGTCNSDCLGYGAGGFCGDGKVQKKTDAECTAYIAEDPVNRKLCDENITTNCCEVVDFVSTEINETCDEGKGNGYHGHCNLTCSGISSCGDGELGRDEACEPPNYFGKDITSINCNYYQQFSSGVITECDIECMPVLETCVNNDAYVSPFFNTNQTLCYDNSNDIACPAKAEDFYGQSPQFSYIEQDFTADGETIYEANSELTWQQATPASYEGCAAGTSCTLEEARNYCSNLELGSHNDWRLPSAFDFPTIADFEAADHIYSGFENTSGAYWTNEGLAFSTTSGTMTGGYSTAQVKCVRSNNKEEYCSICRPYNSVIQYNFAIITSYPDDVIVIWHFGSPMTSDTWQQALYTCKNININGINRMRLPTVNELISLIDTTSGGSLIPGFAGKAWTSTTLNSDATQAYVVDFSALSLTTDSKTNSNYIICVE